MLLDMGHQGSPTAIMACVHSNDITMVVCNVGLALVHSDIL